MNLFRRTMNRARSSISVWLLWLSSRRSMKVFRRRIRMARSALLYTHFIEQRRIEHDAKCSDILSHIHARLPELEKLFEEMSHGYEYEDSVYRYYHQSWKVYRLQTQTKRIVTVLRELGPSGTTSFCPHFEIILREGMCDKKFEEEHNREWARHTRPILEAFFHARYFLEMAVRYGKELKALPDMLPSGLAALLCLYKLR